jgi:enamine deaminase RidA (YjgF/YER057c/UK114 family)
MTALQRVIVNTAEAPQPVGLYSQAMRVRARELMFIAGQIALDAEGKLVGKNDAGTQTRQIYKNIGAILHSVGASFSNVVEFTTYVVGKEALQAFMQARTEIFPSLYPDGDYPPNTLLVVSALVREEYLVEIKAVVALP